MSRPTVSRPVGQSASLSWCQALIWGTKPDFYYCQTVAGLLTPARAVKRSCRLRTPAAILIRELQYSYFDCHYSVLF
jgi:hypothetical protein